MKVGDKIGHLKPSFGEVIRMTRRHIRPASSIFIRSGTSTS